VPVAEAAGVKNGSKTLSRVDTLGKNRGWQGDVMPSDFRAFSKPGMCRHIRRAPGAFAYRGSVLTTGHFSQTAFP